MDEDNQPSEDTQAKRTKFLIFIVVLIAACAGVGYVIVNGGIHLH